MQPAPDDINDANEADESEQRLAELLERRRVGALTDSEHVELESIFAVDPESRALAQELDREDLSMNAAIDTATSHFDFDKARRAIEQKARLDRVGFRVAAVMAAGVIVASFVLRYPHGHWSQTIFTSTAMALAFGIWYLISHRRVRAARAAMTGRLPVEEAYRQHIRSGRNEWTMFRAAAIFTALGLLLVAIEASINGKWPTVIVVTICATVLGHVLWRTRFGRRAKARHERFLAGDLDLDAWVRGHDGPSSPRDDGRSREDDDRP